MERVWTANNGAKQQGDVKNKKRKKRSELSAEQSNKLRDACFCLYKTAQLDKSETFYSNFKE